MKTFVKTVLQCVLFLVTFIAGSFLAPLHLRLVLASGPQGMRIFVWDGLVLATLLCALILILEAMRRRLAAAGRWTALAFVLATLAGLVAKVGFMTIPQ